MGLITKDTARFLSNGSYLVDRYFRDYIVYKSKIYGPCGCVSCGNSFFHIENLSDIETIKRDSMLNNVKSYENVIPESSFKLFHEYTNKTNRYICLGRLKNSDKIAFINANYSSIYKENIKYLDTLKLNVEVGRSASRKLQIINLDIEFESFSIKGKRWLRI